MSRSYKKNPFLTDNGNSKNEKRIANRKFRRQINLDEDMPARPRHKKYTESWDICDYKWRMTKQEAIDWYHTKMKYEASDYFKKHYPTLEAWLKYWEKCYRRKQMDWIEIKDYGFVRPEHIIAITLDDDYPLEIRLVLTSGLNILYKSYYNEERNKALFELEELKQIITNTTTANSRDFYSKLP